MSDKQIQYDENGFRISGSDLMDVIIQMENRNYTDIVIDILEIGNNKLELRFYKNISVIKLLFSYKVKCTL